MFSFALLFLALSAPISHAGKTDCRAENLNKHKASTAQWQKKLNEADSRLNQLLQANDTMVWGFTLELLKNFKERGQSFPKELAADLMLLNKKVSAQKAKPQDKNKKEAISIYYLVSVKILASASFDRVLEERLQSEQEKIRTSNNEVFRALETKAYTLKNFFREREALQKLVIPCEVNGEGRPTLF